MNKGVKKQEVWSELLYNSLYGYVIRWQSEAMDVARGLAVPPHDSAMFDFRTHESHVLTALTTRKGEFAGSYVMFIETLHLRIDTLHAFRKGLLECVLKIITNNNNGIKWDGGISMQGNDNPVLKLKNSEAEIDGSFSTKWNEDGGITCSLQVVCKRVCQKCRKPVRSFWWK
jgi:hypothetical protein